MFVFFKRPFRSCALLFGVGMIVLQATGLYSFLDPLIQWRLSRNGITLDNFHYRNGILSLRGVHLSNKNVTCVIQTVTVPCGLRDLWLGRIDKIEIDGLNGVATLNNDPLGKIPMIPCQHLSIKNSCLTVNSSVGGMEIPFDLNLQAKDTQTFQGQWSTQGYLQSNGFFQGDSHSLTLDIQTLESPRVGKLLKPLSLHLALENKGFTASLVYAKIALLHARGQTTPSSTSITLDGTFPHLSDIVDITHAIPEGKWSGDVSVKGTITWENDRITGPLSLILKDISFDAPSLKILHLKGPIVFESLSPLITQKSQKLKAERILVKDQSFSDVKTAFSFSPTFTPIALEAKVLEGTILVHDFHLKRGGSVDCHLQFTNVELEKLLSAFEVKDLSASAKVSGMISMTWSPTQILLKQVKLSSVAPGGVFHYRLQPPAGPDGGNAQLALEVLQNFHFEVLDATVDCQENADTCTAQVRMLGANPDVLRAHPFDFKITTSGKLKELMYGTLQSLYNPRQIPEVSRILKPTPSTP